MTTRHGFSSALRSLPRLPPSASYSRSFSASRRHLKEHDHEENDASPKDADYDYRKPCYAARRNCTFNPVATTLSVLNSRSIAVPAHIRHLMRSTPNALTAIISCPSPQRYRDDPSATSEIGHFEPAPEVAHNHHMDPLPKVAGLLVSSFNTVTLTPKPYASFNIRLPSITYSIIKASNGFTASGLKDARVADAFAKRKFTPRDPYGENFWRDLVEEDDRLKKDKGGTWWMRCRLQGDKCVEVGDHMIIVAKILECGGYEGGEGIGLIHAEGGYRTVGEAVDVRGENSDD